MAKKLNLREQKKEDTRAAITTVATRMFVERGFDNVTVAEIATAANVAKMTVFNYFPRKEDLFFDREEETRTLVKNALQDRAPGESILAALHRLAITLIEERHPFAKASARTSLFWRTVEQSEALMARARELNAVLERDLTKALADAAGKKRRDPDAHLIAALFLSAWKVAYTAALRRRRAGDEGEVLRTLFRQIVERAFSGINTAMAGTPYVAPSRSPLARPE